MNEQEIGKIQKQAKEIMEKFALTLQSVKFKEIKMEAVGGGMREEGDGLATDKDFRKMFLANAPLVENGLIIAEKKKW